MKLIGWLMYFCLVIVIGLRLMFFIGTPIEATTFEASTVLFYLVFGTMIFGSGYMAASE